MTELLPQLLLATAAGVAVPPLLLLPFVLILAAIALMPFVHRDWWEQNYHYTALALGSITIAYYLWMGAGERMLHVGEEYVSFIALIGSLFVVAGGIHLTLEGESKPLGNACFLLTGAVLANLIGTTGASMLLIRPWLRMNRRRITAFHVVFFIFIVSNVGGCLTPIGDPPLFLGYLRGVPFWWVLQQCWSGWLIAVLLLTGIFYVLDRRNLARVPLPIREGSHAAHATHARGLHNFLFLAVIIGAVFVSAPVGLREVLMIGAALGSWFTTHRDIHRANDFDFHPIKEVAWLFFGIFATMVPALDFLQTHASSLGLNSEMKFYWVTGVFSGFLDNAPTYLTLLSAAVGEHGARWTERKMYGSSWAKKGAGSSPSR